MSLFCPRKPSKPGARLSIWYKLFGGEGLFGNDSNGKWLFKSGVYFYKPNFPPSSSGGKSSLPKRFLIKDDLGSCFKCWGWDGTNEIGPAVYVAKRPEIRMVNESDIMGDVTYAYTYDLGAADTSSFAGDIPEATQLTANGDGSGGAGSKMNTDQSQLHYLKRTTTPDDGSAAITEHITPPPHFNSLIYAVPISTETLDGQQCSWMDTSGREWADDLGT